jgi:hypothetical protein
LQLESARRERAVGKERRAAPTRAAADQLVAPVQRTSIRSNSSGGTGLEKK